MEPFTYVLNDCKKNTDGSCAVLAIAAAAEASYTNALNAALELGFKPHKGTPTWRRDAADIIKKHTGATFTDEYNLISGLTNNYAVQPTTLRRVLKQYPTGRFAVTISGHIFAVIDGNVIDNGYYIPAAAAVKRYGRRKIYRVQRVTPGNIDFAALDADRKAKQATQTKPGAQLSLF